MITVYILRLSDNTYYTGITRDFDRRQKEHNRKRCRYTSTRLPFTVVFTTTRPDYKTAAKLERYIKQVGAKKYMLREAKSVVIQSTGLNSFLVAQA